jgi:thiol:disulfide interchange protein DsbC
MRTLAKFILAAGIAGAAGLPLVLASAATPAATSATAAAEDAKIASIRATLTERFPKTIITNIRESPMAGLYEIVNTDGEIAYSDAVGNYLLLGQLLNTRTKQNLTRARLQEVNAIAFESLPLDLAIKTVRGNGDRQLAVFADPDCPYCQKLETELANITDITIYTFLHPLADLHPDAPHKAQVLWCAKDRSVAWSNWMVKREMVAETLCQPGPFDTIAELGKKLRINSTPTLFLASGQRLSGALTQAELEKLLSVPPQSASPQQAQDSTANSP